MADDSDDLLLSISMDQATLRRSIQRIEADIAKSTGGMAQAFAKVGKAVDDIGSSPAQQRINAMLGIGAKATREWTGALVDQEAQMNRLRAQYNPLFRVFDQYKSAKADLQLLLRTETISQNEYNASLSRMRTEALASVGAIKARNAAIAATPADNAIIDSSASFRRSNVGHQLFDIGSGVAAGMPISMVATQQVPQIIQAYSENGGLKAVKSDLAAVGTGALSVVRSIGPIGIAFTVAGAAALAFYELTKKQSRSAEDVLKQEQDAVARIRDLWGEAADKRSKYGKDSSDAASFNLDQSITELQKKIAEDTKAGGLGAAMTNSLSQHRDELGMTATQFHGTDLFKKLHEDFGPLQQDALQGGDKVIDFMRELEEIGKRTDNSGIKAVVTDIVSWLEPFKKLAEALREARLEKERLFNDIGPGGFILSQGPTAQADNDAQKKYDHDQQVSADQASAILKAQIATMMARSPIEKKDAAEQTAATVHIQDESQPARDLRIANAGTMALIAAQHELQQAQDDRAISMQKMVADQKEELDLVGKLGGEAAALRKQYDLTSEAEAAAAKANTTVSQKELDLIKQKSAEYGKYVDLLNQAKMQDDLAYGYRQLGRSTQDQAVADKLRGYGFNDDLNSQQAQAIRQQMQAQELRSMSDEFAANLSNGLVSSGGHIGQALGQAIMTSLQEEAQKELTNIFSKLFAAVIPALTGTPAASTAGALTSGVAGVAGKVLAPANNNTTSTSPFAGATATVAGLLPQAQTSTDISRYADAIKSIESGGNYGVIGPMSRSGDRPYGAYQVMGNNVGPWTQQYYGQTLTPDQFLANHDAQDAVFQGRFGGYADKYGPSGAASMWISGHPNPTGAADVLGTTDTAYVNKFNAALGDASKNVNTFGAGLGDMGKDLSNVFPAAPTAPTSGGFGSWLSGLFSSPFHPIGAQATAAFNGTLSPGLFADGGHVIGAGGPRDDKIAAMLSNGEFVVNSDATKKNRAFLEAINNGHVMRLADGGFVTPSLVPVPVAPALMPSGGLANDNGPRAGELHVHIHGASGDDHVRALVNQGVVSGLDQYNRDQERGGFGNVQNRWAMRKG